MAYSFPINIEWNITNYCNMNCIFCSVKASKSKDFNFLNTDNIEEITKNIYESGCIYVSLSGGEPMTHPYFFDIIEQLRNKDIKVTLTTNGTLLNQHELDKLEHLGVTWTQISLLGGTKEVNDRLMGGEAYDKIWNAIELLDKSSIDYTVSVLALNENQHEIDLMREQLKKIRGSYFIRGLLKVGKASENKILDYESNSLFLRRKRCSNFLSIMANGEIQPCAEFTISLGNILKDNLSEVWRNNKIVRLCDEDINECAAEKFMKDESFRSNVKELNAL